MRELHKKYLLFHLPKTGGSSLVMSFRQWLGHEAVENIARRDLPEGLHKIDPLISAINGHFDFIDLPQYLDLDAWQKIVWLRDPVNRVVSNYHFFKKTLTHPKPHAVERARINAHRVNEPLLTYAALSENRNTMSSMLNGANPSDFDFIGQLETMSADLERLAGQLGFPVLTTVPRVNVTAYAAPTEREIEEIRALNQEDIVWYKEWKAAAENRR